MPSEVQSEYLPGLIYALGIVKGIKGTGPIQYDLALDDAELELGHAIELIKQDNGPEITMG